MVYDHNTMLIRTHFKYMKIDPTGYSTTISCRFYLFNILISSDKILRALFLIKIAVE